MGLTPQSRTLGSRAMSTFARPRPLRRIGRSSRSAAATSNSSTECSMSPNERAKPDRPAAARRREPRRAHPRRDNTPGRHTPTRSAAERGACADSVCSRSHQAEQVPVRDPQHSRQIRHDAFQLIPPAATPLERPAPRPLPRLHGSQRLSTIPQTLPGTGSPCNRVCFGCGRAARFLRSSWLAPSPKDPR
jgi:hypothetical protein